MGDLLDYEHPEDDPRDADLADNEAPDNDVHDSESLDFDRMRNA